MQFDEALKILGLELGGGDKVKVNPFEEVNQANEVWHESVMRFNMATTPQTAEHRKQIERADWQIVDAWDALIKFYCDVCGYVVSPDRYHRHCPDCKRLLSRKVYQLEPEDVWDTIVEVIETCPKCGEVKIPIISQEE